MHLSMAIIELEVGWRNYQAVEAPGWHMCFWMCSFCSAFGTILVVGSIKTKKRAPAQVTLEKGRSGFKYKSGKPPTTLPSRIQVCFAWHHGGGLRKGLANHEQVKEHDSIVSQRSKGR